jgi:hypothetical protein
MQKSFSTPGPVSLYVEVGAGGITVHTDVVTETVVDLNGKDADQVMVEQRGDEIVIVARQRGSSFFGRSNDLDVHVSAPFDSRLTTKLGSADVRVMGRLGQSMLRAGSGDIQLEEVAGDLYVETGSGDLGIDEITGELQVKSGSGDVSIDRINGTATISTGSGDVRVGLRRPHRGRGAPGAGGRQERLGRHPGRHPGRGPGLDRHLHDDRVRPLEPRRRRPARGGPGLHRAAGQDGQRRHPPGAAVTATPRTCSARGEPA